MKTAAEKNRMIAEFMGMEHHYHVDGSSYFETPNNGATVESDELNYYTSWDWLMPVVEKIENTSVDNKDNSDNFFNVVIEAFECDINGGGNTIHANGHTKKEATYKAVVEFIEWYNENK